MINIKQIAKFVVGLGDKVAPTDVEEGMRVGSVRHELYQPSPHVASHASSLTVSHLAILYQG